MVLLKMKPIEFGKYGKPGRTIADLGTNASTAGLVPLKENKKVVARGECVLGWKIGRVYVQYVPTANLDVLSEMWESMYMPSVPVAKVSGDDSCFAVPCTDGVLWGKMDLAQCDTTVFTPTFEVGKRQFPDFRRKEVANLYRQTRTTALIRRKGGGFYRMKPIGDYLYSGWAGTTKTGTDASIIHYNYMFRGWVIRSRSETKAFLKARSRGPYVGEIVFCDDYEEMDFLKTFPAMGMDGRWHATLCLGTLLRSLGQKSYDLPGSGSLAMRAYAFNAALMQSFTHSGNHTLFRVLKSKFSMPRLHFDVKLEGYILNEMVMLTDAVELLDISVERRYKVNNGLSLLANEYKQAGFGDIITHFMIDAIFEMDYGAKQKQRNVAVVPEEWSVR